MEFDTSDVEVEVVHRRARTEPIELEELLEELEEEPSVIVDPELLARGSSPRLRTAAGTTPPPSDGTPLEIDFD